MSQLNELLEKVFQEIKTIKEDLEEIKAILIPEVEPTEEELALIAEGEKEIEEKKFKEWSEAKKELE